MISNMVIARIVAFIIAAAMYTLAAWKEREGR
jgi:hypothetical protein